MKRRAPILAACWLLACVTGTLALAAETTGLRVGTSAIPLKADDTMVIAGGIGPRTVQGQEGELRATAMVLAEGSTKVAFLQEMAAAAHH